MGYLSFRDLAREGVRPLAREQVRSIRGMMADFDASGWIREGGGCLVGWTSGPSRVTLEGEAPGINTDTFVRVFIR